MDYNSAIKNLIGFIFICSVLRSSDAQTCSSPCPNNQYCGNVTDPVSGVTTASCRGCNVACNGCTGLGPDNCKLCAGGFYDGGGICRGCNVACNNCTGPGPENCKLCAAGFYDVGGICRGCLDNKFGVNCTGDCHCLLGPSDCSKVDGACGTNQCDRGWQEPPFCQKECDPGTFGKDCQFVCHCPENDTCSLINGLCSSGNCLVGYGGPGCQTQLPRLKDPPIVDAFCRRANITWRNWVENFDIGVGPIARYTVVYRVNGTNEVWQTLQEVPYSQTTGTYFVSHTNLDITRRYQYRVDVRRKDGDKVMQEWVPGFPTYYFSVECIATTTTTIAPPVTPSRPPPGSLFNPDFSAQYVRNNTMQVTWSTKTNYSAIIGNVTLSYGVIGIGDCRDLNVTAADFTTMPVNKSGSVEINVILWRKYRVVVEADTIHHNVSDNDRRISLEFGPQTNPELQTEPSGNVENIQVTTATSHSATFTWELPVCENRGGFLKQYDVQVRNLDNSSTAPINVSTNKTTVTVTSLLPHNRHSVRIRFVNVVGNGPYSNEVIFWSEEAAPAAPEITSTTSGINDLTLSYTRPSPANGVIQQYQVAYSIYQDFRDPTYKPANETTYTITELKAFTWYYVKVRARTNAPDWGQYSETKRIQTGEDYPTAPSNVTFTFRNETCLGVEWVFPVSQSGRITEYRIQYMDTTVDKEKKTKYIPDATPGPHYVCGLSPGKRHMFEVSAKTGRGYGPSKTEFRTTEQATPPAPSRPIYINHTETTITVAIDPVQINTGPLSFYAIFVHDITGRRKRQTGIPPGYMAVLYEPSSVTTRTVVTIGDESLSYNNVLNAPLEKNHRYNIYLQITSTLEGITKSNFSVMDGTILTAVQMTSPPPPQTLVDDNTGVIVAIIVIVVLLLIALIIVGIIIWYKRRHPPPPYEPFHPEKEHIDMSKILHDSYDPHKHWNTIHSHRESRYIIAGRELLPEDVLQSNGTVGNYDNSPPITFQQEFHDLPHGQLASWNAALHRKNKNKNRFPHLLPYDHTRVILDRDENSDNDYINANYIHGYKKSCAYIAAQSPFDDETVLDFWRMLYQLDIRVVVMITNIVEDQIIKCTQYWPDQEGRVTYGSFRLELIDYLEYADYIIRTVKIKTKSNAHTKVVHLFEFCSWPDHGVPGDAIPLLEMRHKVREYHGGNKSPIVVHCGTGVSRTGAYIAIDSLLEQYQIEGRISVSSFVRRLRKDRVTMVRTVKQYVFIYEAIFEARVAGDTRTGLDLKQKYHTLTMKNPKTKHSFLRDQFICLQRYTRALTPQQCSSALVPVNIDKNRFPDVVPPDNLRPHLVTPGGLGRTDYVNAVFLDSHRYKNHFIVTQTPLHTTVIDFWKLVYDYNVSTIVMMESYRHEDDTCAEYWPEKKIKKFEPFFVDNTEIYQQENVTIRHFKLSSMHKPSEPSRQIRQFQFNAWDDTEFVPKSKTMFLDLFDLVDDWQRVSDNHDSPIIVHCKDGATHSGLFCAAYVVCETMREDGDVDVFHTVKHMKRRRTQIIDTVDQYRYCYKVLWDFMNLRQEGGTLTDMMNHTSADRLYNVGSLSLPSYTSHLEYA